MDAIHAEEVEIARARLRGLSSISSSVRGAAGTTTSSGRPNIAEVMMIHGFRFVEEFERLEVRRNRLATLRASITHENLKSAFHATERAILDQLKLELLMSATTFFLNEKVAAPAPEIEEGLKRVSITKQSSSSSSSKNNCGGQQAEGGEILDVCAICHEEWKIGDDVRSVVGCSHAYHYNCITKWIKRKPSCPMCRYEIPTNNNNKRRRTLDDEDLIEEY